MDKENYYNGHIICPMKDKKLGNKYVHEFEGGRIYYKLEGNKYVIYFISKKKEKGKQ